MSWHSERFLSLTNYQMLASKEEHPPSPHVGLWIEAAPLKNWWSPWYRQKETMASCILVLKALVRKWHATHISSALITYSQAQLKGTEKGRGTVITLKFLMTPTGETPTMTSERNTGVKTFHSNACEVTDNEFTCSQQRLAYSRKSIWRLRNML